MKQWSDAHYKKIKDMAISSLKPELDKIKEDNLEKLNTLKINHEEELRRLKYFLKEKFWLFASLAKF